MTNLSILPQVPVIAVWADNDLLRTVFVDMPLEKSFLKFGQQTRSRWRVPKERKT